MGLTKTRLPILFTALFLGTVQSGELQSLFNGTDLENWKETDFRERGRVYVEDGKIVLEAGETLTGITWASSFPTVDYEVTVEAMRVSGNDIFCGLTFPVLDSFCSLIIGGWGGSIVGISNVDGWDASNNPTTQRMYFKKNQWYRIRLRVTTTAIQAWIDNAQVIDLVTTDRFLSTRPDVWKSKPFGLISWRTAAAFRTISLKRISTNQK